MARASAAEHRTQRERAEATTEGLLEAARRLFAHDGYEATSLAAIAAAAGVTKGALYHHFVGKRQLFRAILEREEHRIGELINEALLKKEDPWDGFQLGARTFLDACLDAEAQRILLLDGPAVLGWETVRAIEGESTFHAIRLGLERSIEAKRIAARPVDPLAHLLFGAICEGALSAGRAENPGVAARSLRLELKRLLTALER